MFFLRFLKSGRIFDLLKYYLMPRNISKNINICSTKTNPEVEALEIKKKGNVTNFYDTTYFAQPNRKADEPLNTIDHDAQVFGLYITFGGFLNFQAVSKKVNQYCYIYVLWMVYLHTYLHMSTAFPSIFNCNFNTIKYFQLKNRKALWLQPNL